MSSKALNRWQTVRLQALAEVENAHRAVGGTGPGRRYATSRLNRAYIVLLAAEWQGFCRELHSEAADAVANAVQDPALRVPIRAAFTSMRRMDRGNADAADVGGDFSKFGMSFWTDVQALDKRNPGRQTRLRQLYVWRNTIVHDSVTLTPDDAKLVADSKPTLDWAHVWRDSCAALATQVDRAVGRYVGKVIGTPPW